MGKVTVIIESDTNDTNQLNVVVTEWFNHLAEAGLTTDEQVYIVPADEED